MNNRRNIILIILGVFACLIIAAVGAAGAFFLLRQSSLEDGHTQTAEENEDPETGPDDGAPLEISPAVRREMESIEREVADIRGLQPGGEILRLLFTRQDLQQRVKEDFFSEYTPEEAQDDAQVLGVFGLLDPSYDMIALFEKLYGEQIVGFYDTETREMVVVQSSEFSGEAKLTYAHEYMHALQDQNFKFEEGLDYNDESCEADSERCAAIQALIEGEATLLELEWFTEYATRKEQAEVIDYYDNLESPIFDETPAFLRLDLIFPYDQGYTFAQTLFEAGGWEALDEAYANLPLSTEQILHPEKYPADRPLAVDLPGFSDVLGDEWELIDENVMGEWYTYLILGHGMDEDARLSERKAARAAEGWGGDRYVVFLNRESGEIIMALLTFWDHPDEANEFASAFQEYAEARYGQRGVDENEFVSWETEGEFVLFFAQGDHTIWISAPDRLVAQAVFKLIK